MAKIHSGLVSFATMLCASAVFAEPPLQPGDTLESLSQVKVETTINGQPGSLEQMGISKQMIAQAIEQNAVIDLQNQTLIASSPANVTQTEESLVQQVQPSSLTEDAQTQASAPVVVSDDPNVLTQMEQQPVTEFPPQVVANDQSAAVESEANALAQGESQQLTEDVQQVAAQQIPVDQVTAVEAETNNLAQGDAQQLAVQHSHSDVAVIAEADPNMVAIQPNQEVDQNIATAMPEQSLEDIDPNAQAVPAQSEQEETQQYGDTESGMPTPLQ